MAQAPPYVPVAVAQKAPLTPAFCDAAGNDEHRGRGSTPGKESDNKDDDDVVIDYSMSYGQWASLQPTTMVTRLGFC